MKVDYTQIHSNYLLGLSDIKNAKIVGCSKGTVRKWRNKNNYSPNFIPNKDVKINKENFLELYNKGLTDLKIAQIINSSESSVNYFRNKLNLKSNQSHDIEIDPIVEQILIGTILGDAYISCKANTCFAYMKCS